MGETFVFVEIDNIKLLAYEPIKFNAQIKQLKSRRKCFNVSYLTAVYLSDISS